MAVESTLPDRGETKQWYEQLPERFEEEKILMNRYFPSFRIHYSPGENIYWTGQAIALKKDGSVLNALDVKIECLPDYPARFPMVYETKGKLKPGFCPHLTKMPDGNHSLCYGNRLDPDLNFEELTRVKDVVNYICIFAARQWYYEYSGHWPDGQPHGELAFLEREIEGDLINPSLTCPCGLTTKKYRDCHMRAAITLLERDGFNISRALKYTYGKFGRNSPCPCQSQKKFKKCCWNIINYPKNRLFLLLRYPLAFGFTKEERDKLFEVFIWRGEGIQTRLTLPIRST